MDVNANVSEIAAAIGEPARMRMLSCLMDGHARTSTELAIVAGVSASTASVHLTRLLDARLVKVHAQGKHRYYALSGPEVADVLEGMMVLAGAKQKFVPSTPDRLRLARTCYDHMAGTLGVALHDACAKRGWLRVGESYELTSAGARQFATLGVDVDAARALRRRFACACLDWSERKPHLGGALGAALLQVALKKKWVTQELDERELAITARGKREMLGVFGVQV